MNGAAEDVKKAGFNPEKTVYRKPSGKRGGKQGIEVGEYRDGEFVTGSGAKGSARDRYRKSMKGKSVLSK